MAGTPNVRLKLANKAENVLLVRQALSGLADIVGLDAVALNDISTAVTEACNNVVLHAYRGDEGPLEVELSTVHEGIDVLVRDHGEGIRPGVKVAEEVSGGIGLPVIQALSDSVDFRDVPGGGTEVAMRFEAPQARAAEDEQDGAYEAAANVALDGERERTHEVLAMTVGPQSIASGVLPRVLSTLAARAYFTTDGISDTQRLADALVARAHGSIAAPRMSLGVSVTPRHLDVRIGPLESGRAGALLAASEEDGPSLPEILERLLEGHEVQREGALEMLDLRLFQRD